VDKTTFIDWQKMGESTPDPKRYYMVCHINIRGEWYKAHYDVKASLWIEAGSKLSLPCITHFAVLPAFAFPIDYEVGDLVIANNRGPGELVGKKGIAKKIGPATVIVVPEKLTPGGNTIFYREELSKVVEENSDAYGE